MYFKKNFNIGKVKIGENNRALIVAEISANHKNNLKTIKKLIISAKKSGADLIKIQTYTPDSLTINSKKKDFKIKKKILGLRIKRSGIYMKNHKQLMS